MNRIFVAGHRGLVGSAIVRVLEKKKDYEILTKGREELDLFIQDAVLDYVKSTKPDCIIIAAAKVGGIHANSTYPVEFLLENLKIQNNLIEAAHQFNVNRLVFLGSTCIYPKYCPQPMKPEHLLTSPLEPTNEPYALAKIAGIRLCQAYRREYGRDYISIMPTNLYGPGDNFDLQNSHVLPAMVRKFHDAKVAKVPKMTLWGTGSSRREFLYVDDLAEGVVWCMENYHGEDPINIGYGKDLTVKELAEKVKKIVGFEGEIAWDSSKPDGTPLKLADSSVILKGGWKPQTDLDEGIKLLYQWFLKNPPQK